MIDRQPRKEQTSKKKLGHARASIFTSYHCNDGLVEDSYWLSFPLLLRERYNGIYVCNTQRRELLIRHMKEIIICNTFLSHIVDV